MKKVLALVLAVLMIVSMCACSSAKKEDTVETIKIGLAFPMSGTAAMAGKYSTHGADVLKEELGGKITVGDKEYPVEFVTMDTEGSEEKTTNVYQKLIEEEKVIAIVGPDSSKCMLAAAPIAQNAKCPAITTFGTNTAVTEVGNYISRACFIDPFQGEKMASYAVEKLGAKTAAVFFQTGSDYSEGLKDAFVAKAEELGLEIVDTEAFAEGDKDFKAQMTNIAAKAPDVVFAPIYYAEAGLAITAARAAGCTATFMGGDGFGSVKNYASADDLEGSVYCSGYAPGTDSVKQFEEDYKAAYNVDEIPNMFAPLAYDAAMLLCEGLKAAEAQGLTAGTDEYKQAVIDAIKTMDGTEGITGSYAFDEFNNPIKPVAIIELTGGNEVYQEMF